MWNLAIIPCYYFQSRENIPLFSMIDIPVHIVLAWIMGSHPLIDALGCKSNSSLELTKTMLNGSMCGNGR